MVVAEGASVQYYSESLLEDPLSSLLPQISMAL